MVPILSKFIVLCIYFYFVAYFLKLKLILFYIWVVCYYTRIFLILLELNIVQIQYSKGKKNLFNSKTTMCTVVFWLVNTSSSNNKTNHDMWGKYIFTGKSIHKRETVSNKNIGLVIE